MVREGYKQTEVEVIPEDWEIYPCSTVCKMITVGIVIRPTQYYVTFGVPAFRSANIRENGIDISELVFISPKSNIQLKKSQVQADDVLTVRTGYPGTSAVVPPEFSGSNCIDILISRPSAVLDSHYLAAWINSSFGKKQILRQQGGLAQQHFNVRELKDLLVALPSLAEQRLIAQALSDVDALIAALDKLIAKKRTIKTGTMQQLLAGKKRLPGFGEGKGYKKTEVGAIPEDWEETNLANIVDIIDGDRGTNYPGDQDFSSDGYCLFLSARNVTKNGFRFSECFFINEGKDRLLRKGKLSKKDIVLTTRGTVGNFAFFDKSVPFENIRINSGMVLLRNQIDNLDHHFLYMLSRSYIIQNQIERAVFGSAQPQLTVKGISNFKIPLPSSKKEQEAIAKVLSDMDAEIAALETRRAKTQAIKQGMMQELLTGKTRLI